MQREHFRRLKDMHSLSLKEITLIMHNLITQKLFLRRTQVNYFFALISNTFIRHHGKNGNAWARLSWEEDKNACGSATFTRSTPRTVCDFWIWKECILARSLLRLECGAIKKKVGEKVSGGILCIRLVRKFETDIEFLGKKSNKKLSKKTLFQFLQKSVLWSFQSASNFWVSTFCFVSI